MSYVSVSPPKLFAGGCLFLKLEGGTKLLKRDLYFDFEFTQQSLKRISCYYTKLDFLFFKLGIISVVDLKLLEGEVLFGLLLINITVST